MDTRKTCRGVISSSRGSMDCRIQNYWRCWKIMLGIYLWFLDFLVPLTPLFLCVVLRNVVSGALNGLDNSFFTLENRNWKHVAHSKFMNEIKTINKKKNVPYPCVTLCGKTQWDFSLWNQRGCFGKQQCVLVWVVFSAVKLWLSINRWHLPPVCSVCACLQLWCRWFGEEVDFHDVVTAEYSF